jgi:hypothetical protein
LETFPQTQNERPVFGPASILQDGGTRSREERRTFFRDGPLHGCEITFAALVRLVVLLVVTSSLSRAYARLLRGRIASVHLGSQMKRRDETYIPIRSSPSLLRHHLPSTALIHPLEEPTSIVATVGAGEELASLVGAFFRGRPLDGGFVAATGGDVGRGLTTWFVI